MNYCIRFLLRSFVFCLMFSFSQFSSAFTYTLEIPEQELQEKIDMMMPLERKSFFATVVLSDPKVDLIKKNNEIGFFSHVEVLIPGGLKGSGRGKIKGSLVYDSDQGAFYLNNPSIEDLVIDRVPQKFYKKISAAIQVVLAKSLLKYPVYKLKDDDVKHQLAKSTLKSISVGNKKLLITLGF